MTRAMNSKATTRQTIRAHTLHVDLLRACAMLLPLGLGSLVPLPDTAWSVPVAWIFAFTSVPSIPLIRATPDTPAWWMPIWTSVVFLYRALLTQAAAIFQLEEDSFARSVLIFHAWGSMVYMATFLWFTYVASRYTIPAALVARPFPRLHVVF